MMRVVLTGGPSAGKTSLLDILVQDLGRKVSAVPEAATILYRGGYPRRAEAEARRCVQRAIYHVQASLERLTAATTPAPVMLMDRGSLDGCAYWPRGGPEYLDTVGTTESAELARYDLVIHLRTPKADGYRLTGVRNESLAEALRLDRRIAAAWSRHPKRFFIEASPQFETKVRAVKELLTREIPGLSEPAPALAPPR